MQEKNASMRQARAIGAIWPQLEPQLDNDKADLDLSLRTSSVIRKHRNRSCQVRIRITMSRRLLEVEIRYQIDVAGFRLAVLLISLPPPTCATTPQSAQRHYPSEPAQ